MPELKTLSLDVIRLDGDTQTRELNTDKVTEYAARMDEGDDFPAPIVVFDGGDYWLAVGFHRYHAMRKNRKTEMVCEVHMGTVRDAIWMSLGSNNHGLPLTNAEKRRSVERVLDDFEWSARSDRQIAAHLGNVSHVMVFRMRRERAQAKEGKPSQSPAKEKPAEVKPEVSNKKLEEVTAQIEAMKAKAEQLQHQIEEVVEMNTDLTDQLAVKSARDPAYTQRVLNDLREENRNLMSQVKALTISRDQFQAENAQLIKQVNFLTKKLKKYEAVA